MPTLKQTAVVLEAAATEMERMHQILADTARQLRDADLEMSALRTQAACDRAEIARLTGLVAQITRIESEPRPLPPFGSTFMGSPKTP